jgi:hypothetical protein
MEVAMIRGCFETHEFIHCEQVMKGPLKDPTKKRGHVSSHLSHQPPSCARQIGHQMAQMAVAQLS